MSRQRGCGRARSAERQRRGPCFVVQTQQVSRGTGPIGGNATCTWLPPAEPPTREVTTALLPRGGFQCPGRIRNEEQGRTAVSEPEPESTEREDGSTARGPGSGTRGAWFLKLAVSALLLAWIVSRADLGAVVAGIRSAHLGLVGLALGLNVVGWAISITRWRILLATKDAEVSFRTLLQSHLSAIFFNNLLPSTIGGDTLRIYDSWRFGAGKGGAVAVVGVDRLLGFLALLVLAVGALLLAPTLAAGLPYLPLWLGAATAGLLGLAGCALLPAGRFSWLVDAITGRLPESIQRLLDKISQAFEELRNAPRASMQALALSFLLQVNVILHFYLIAMALELAVPLTGLFLVVPLTLVIIALPVSVNAIGIREGAFAFFLGLYGVSTADALAFSWIAFGLVLLQGGVGGVVYALRTSV